jgi:hypothetical protein
MHEVNTIDELAELLRCQFPSSLTGTIAMDGRDGVGKTTLAIALRGFAGGEVISVDDYVAEHQGTYVSSLKVLALQVALEGAGIPRIVEGVCLLNVLEKARHDPDVLIYVRRVTADGFWHDQDTCDPDEPVDELIAQLSADMAAFARLDAELSGQPLPDPGTVTLTPLREEIIRYHADVRPSRRAHILVSLAEGV